MHPTDTCLKSEAYRTPCSRQFSYPVVDKAKRRPWVESRHNSKNICFLHAQQTWTLPGTRLTRYEDYSGLDETSKSRLQKSGANKEITKRTQSQKWTVRRSHPFGFLM